eukprot:85312-Pleurochrysis_carterae.AAC.1
MGSVTIYPLTRSDIPFQTRHHGSITDRHFHSCLSVFPVCPLLFNFILDHDAFANPRCDARTHAAARRPRPAAAPRARPGRGYARPQAS